MAMQRYAVDADCCAQLNLGRGAAFFIDDQFEFITDLTRVLANVIFKCLDVGSHTSYYNHVVAFLKSKGYTKPQICKAGSV